MELSPSPAARSLLEFLQAKVFGLEVRLVKASKNSSPSGCEAGLVDFEFDPAKRSAANRWIVGLGSWMSNLVWLVAPENSARR